MSIFVLEDDFHADEIVRFPTRQEAWRDMQRRASDPTSVENQAPCTSWKTCKRDYVIVEYDDSTQPWTRISSERVLTIEGGRATWATEPPS